jgi:hypothetical protein
LKPISLGSAPEVWETYSHLLSLAHSVHVCSIFRVAFVGIPSSIVSLITQMEVLQDMHGFFGVLHCENTAVCRESTGLNERYPDGEQVLCETEE